MQVKYIVYNKEGQQEPIIDIWQTTGEIIHPVYATMHQIRPQDISSQGYLYFNPLTKRWALEHYQMDDGIPARNLKEWLQKRRLEKRDRLLIRRKIYQTSFLNDPRLKKETWEDKKKMNTLSLRQLFTIQND